MPAPSRKAVTGNWPGWRHRNRPQDVGSAQLRSLCTAEGHTGQHGQADTPPSWRGAWCAGHRGLRAGGRAGAEGTWTRAAGTWGIPEEVRQTRGKEEERARPEEGTGTPKSGEGGPGGETE